MSSYYTRKHGYGACERPQQQQQQPQPQPQPQLQLQPQQPDASMMNAKNPESRAWEERGTVFSLLLDVASVACSRIFLLLALVTSLAAGADSFMRCSQEETPGLKHKGEELICHYTKAFIFTFPAMATSVLVLLMGRDFLQKRLYYGLLKNGGVVTFSENMAYKDPFVMAMFVDFLHCVAYTLFHLLILHRQGQMHDLTVQGFIPESSGVEDAAAFLFAALRGGGPKLGGAKSAGRGTRGTHGEDATGGDYYMQTVMMLVATFTETVFLIIFIWYAYDITASLVPMSEYLAAYEVEEEEDRFDMPRLRTFKDTVAKLILEDSHHIIPAVDGDLDTIYRRVVTKYTANKNEIRGIDHEIVQAAPRMEDPSPRRFSWTILRELSSIGLSRSLWPAELLLRRDIQGHEADQFRRSWVAYTSVAILALASVLFILVGEMLQDLLLLLGSREWEQILPLFVMLVHALIVCIAIWSFVESLAPFVRQPAPQVGL